MKLSRLLVCAAAAVSAFSCARSPEVERAIPYDSAVESKVSKVLRGMTLEEKIGQMTQIAITAIADGTELTAAGDSILRTYKVGSVLNTPGDVAQTPEDYDRLVAQINQIALEETGIPTLYGLDHIHGTSYILGGTLFPQEIAIAATFNRDHAYNMGKVAA